MSTLKKVEVGFELLTKLALLYKQYAESDAVLFSEYLSSDMDAELAMRSIMARVSRLVGEEIAKAAQQPTDS